MSPTLLPCPHCGEAYHLYPAYLKSMAGEDKPYAIDCLGCGADYTPRGDADVIALWNRRAQDPRVKQLEEALRQASKYVGSEAAYGNDASRLFAKIMALLNGGSNERA